VTDPVRTLADAVLYEGYILWPYTRSATKNRQRWTFGGVFPPAHSAAHPDDRPELRAEVIASSPVVDVRVRFLQVVERQLTLDGRPVDELTVGEEHYLSWDEAVEREAGPGPLALAAGTDVEQLDGRAAISRSWEALGGTVEVTVEPLGELFRIAVVVRNETPWTGSARADALRRTFCSTHAVLRSEGEFVSLTDPPPDLLEEARSCENVGCWPVLVGDTHTMLAAPIILSDFPEIAPESPGDLFDATEIDRMLILNVLSMTPEEQAEMRATDPRARQILERCESLTRDDLLRLHGVMR
jgi:hypothetical protein